MTTLYYKCRRCAQLVPGATGTKPACERAIFITVASGEPEPAPRLPAPLLSLHRCKDGELGVTDLVGCGKKS